MSDSYIDPLETQIYGKFAREQMHDVCLGLVPELDATVKFAIKSQHAADDKMKHALEQAYPAASKKPHATPAVDPVAEAGDTIVRFGNYLASLKGRPVDPAEFFRGEAPSLIARRRITKLVGAVEFIQEQLAKHHRALPGSEPWVAEFRELHAQLAPLEKAQRVAKTSAAGVAPDLAAAREAWLAVYTANKALVTGVLRHANKLQLLSHVFDDLAEVHHAQGVTDGSGPAAPTEPGATAATPVAAEAKRAKSNA